MMQQRQSAAAPPVVHEVLRTPGQPLDRAARAFFEPRFGHDFSRVRVHGDPRAAESAAAVSARAYTVGSHIVFGAGEYAPHTNAGRRVLAHELAHVQQQNEGRVGRMLQRWLVVQQASKKAPNQPAGQDPPLTNGQLVQTWVKKLCPEGNWTIKPDGELASATGDEFCKKKTTSTSCGCLCDVTKLGGPQIMFFVADVMNVPEVKGTGSLTPVDKAGEGRVVPPAGERKETYVSVTGREKSGLPGAGGRPLPTPPWLIFAHEVCGHALGKGGHAQTPSGKESTVDIENLIRREHPEDDLGIRRGDIGQDPYAAGPFGAEYELAPGETLQSVAKRLGVPLADITQKPESKRLLIKNLSYHDVIEGETQDSIATMWKIAPSSLRRANSLKPGEKLNPGRRLVIPAK